MIGDNLFYLNSVDSTNNYAMRRVHAGLAKHGFACIAAEQTAGKGQRGKQWQSVAGQNIALSVILNTKSLLFAHQFRLSVMVALAVKDLVEEKSKSDVTIKWPNDIYWRDRKAGGILIENIVQGTEWKYAIAGVGLNVNQTSFSPELPNPVSLKQITGKEWEIVPLAKELCTFLDLRWQQLSDGQFEPMLRDYNDCLYKKGKRVRLKQGNVTFETLIKAVNAEGELLTEEGEVHRFTSGEVQWVI